MAWQACVQHSMKCLGMARHGKSCHAMPERHGMTWQGRAWHGMTWHGRAWHGMAWHGRAWHGMAWVQQCTALIGDSWRTQSGTRRSMARRSVAWSCLMHNPCVSRAPLHTPSRSGTSRAGGATQVLVTTSTSPQLTSSWRRKASRLARASWVAESWSAPPPLLAAAAARKASQRSMACQGAAGAWMARSEADAAGETRLHLAWQCHT